MALKIVYFGTAPFAVPALKALTADPQCEVAAVVSQPDKPAGRHGEVRSSPVAAAARELGLPLLQPHKLKDEAAQKEIIGLNADLFVVAAYGKIIPKTLLDAPKIAPVNLHGSLLPKYRGASPIQAAILAGEKETGVSLMVMDEQVDHGPVIATACLPISPDDTHESLESKLGDLASVLLLQQLDGLAGGKISAEPQDHDKATFTKILGRADGFICWDHETAAEIERKSRAYFPWPGCFATWVRGGKRTQLKVLRARTADGGGNDAPGTVSAENGKMFVRAKEGRIELIEVQPEGKKAMTADVFLNGYKDILGTVLESIAPPKTSKE